MQKNQLIYSLSALLLSASFVAPARADFIAISDPNPSYLGATTKLDVNGNEFDTVTSVSDASLNNTANFFISGFPGILTIYDAGSGWASWSAPPDAESATPQVLGTTPQLGITLDFPALVVGFEAEPLPFGVHSITADFFGGGVLRGSITRDIEGNGGARLFAAYSSLGIDDVEISSTESFAVAQLRYGNDIRATVPEPASGLLLAGVAVFICWYGLRRRSDSQQRECTRIET